MPDGFAPANERQTAEFSVSYIHALMQDSVALYAQAIIEMRAKEERLMREVETFPLPENLHAPLQATKLKRAIPRYDLPITKNDFDRYGQDRNREDTPCYTLVFGSDGKPTMTNENYSATRLFAINQRGKTPHPDLVEHIAVNCLPDIAGGRLPQYEFKYQQTLLSYLAMGGLYEIPKVQVVIARGMGYREPYYKATVDAQHASSPEGNHVWTVCELSGVKPWEHLKSEDYYNLRDQGALVSPLPEEIFQMVRERSELLTKALAWIDNEKALRRKQEIARLDLVLEPEAESQRVTDEPQFHTADDLKKLTNFSGLVAALESIRFAKKEDRKKLVKAVYDFAVDLWDTTQKAIKLAMWGKEIPGEVNVGEYKKKKYLKKTKETVEYPYIKAGTRASSRSSGGEENLEQFGQNQGSAARRIARQKSANLQR